MKKVFLYLFFFGITSCILFFTGCKEGVIEQKMQNRHILTKSLKNSYTDYYWYNKQQISLTKKLDKKFVLFKSDNISSFKNALQQNSIPLQDSDIHDYSCTGVTLYGGTTTKSAENLKWAIISTSTAVKSIPAFVEILYEAPFYISEAGNEFGLSNLFYVKLKSESDVSKLLDLATKNTVKIVGKNIYMPLWYTLSCSKESTGNALEMANLFYESGHFEAGEPDFMMDKLLCVNDPYFNNQWALKNTGQSGGKAGVDINYCNSRSITIGSSNVVVAVLDQGIQLDHPDINNLSLISYDTENHTPLSIVRGNHGTACAGIIGAAANNSLGVTGVAPGITLMSISNSLRSDVVNANQNLANGLNFATNSGASVISNSWGHEELVSLFIQDAINNAINNGRNGLGCVVVFASGNGGKDVVLYPARSHPDIIAVGSVDKNGLKSSFSQYGAEIDVVAPGEDIYTTDLTGENGYSFGDYFSNFTGTSGACPHVAAVAALCLSVNPSLTQRDVANIIESTAKKVGSDIYTVTTGRPNGTWNNKMGYGLLDAYSAVLAASGGSDVNIHDIIYTSNTTVSGEYINAENIIVRNAAKLTLLSTRGVKILPPFLIEANCSLEIN